MTDSEFGTTRPRARRELRREELQNFAGNIEWLRDPSLIPERAIGYEPNAGTQYRSVAKWMIDRFVAWSADAHKKLSYGATFEKHGLKPEERVRVRSMIQQRTEEAFTPGIVAVADIHEMVPSLVSRAQLDPSSWTEIAYKARVFGTGLARDGTLVQGLIRNYLTIVPSSIVLDYSKLRLDEETGVNTVTPFADMVSASSQVVDNHYETEDHSGICIALQTSLEEFGGASAFDVLWDAFGYAAEHYIYPGLQIDGRRVAPEGQPDTHLFENLEAIALEHIAIREFGPNMLGRE